MSVSKNGMIRVYPSREALYTHVERASVLFYTIGRDGVIYFMFAIDSETGDVTDPGGGIKKDETLISGGIREVNEELRDMFREYTTPNYMTKFISASDRKMGTMFVPIPDRWLTDASKRFRERGSLYIKKSYHELNDIHWLSLEDLKNHLRNRRSGMWNRVRKFYRSVITDDVIKLLCTMYNDEYRIDCNNS